MSEWFTVEQLAKMGLRGYPRTGRNWHNRAKAEGWKSREVESAGRKGMRTEYSPPPEIQTLIDARLAGEPLPKQIQHQALHHLNDEERQPANDSMLSISERLRKVITDLNRTAKDVAEDIDLPYRTLQNYLHGEREPNPESLEKISRLGINLHWLLTGEGGMFVQEKSLDAATLSLYPLLALRVSQALFNFYGATYNALGEDAQARLFEKLYQALCHLGATETAIPSAEEIEATLKLSIRLGEAENATIVAKGRPGGEA